MSTEEEHYQRVLEELTKVSNMQIETRAYINKALVSLASRVLDDEAATREVQKRLGSLDTAINDVREDVQANAEERRDQIDDLRRIVHQCKLMFIIVITLFSIGLLLEFIFRLSAAGVL